MSSGRKPTTESTAAHARAHFTEVLGRVRYGHERVVITNKGKRAAAVVSLDDLALLTLLEDDTFRARLTALLGEQPGTPEQREARAQLAETLRHGT